MSLCTLKILIEARNLDQDRYCTLYATHCHVAYSQHAERILITIVKIHQKKLCRMKEYIPEVQNVFCNKL